MTDHPTPERLKYLRLLAERFPTWEALATEIARLQALLKLPQGTEHFMSDIHGEYEAFCHLLNNCSGVIREKVTLWLGRLTPAEMDETCTLIYYPNETLKQLHAAGKTSPAWYRARVEALLHLTQMLGSKYPRETVRRALPEGWAALLGELLDGEVSPPRSEPEENRLRYHHALLDGMLAAGAGDGVLRALAAAIKRLAVSRLHVVGDIYDRGPRADAVMDMLMGHHAVDVEWGNHDILWMGAASGSEACICAVVRGCLHYGSAEMLERGYAIPLRNLSLFAERQYPALPPEEAALHAVTVMMFKLEGQLILRHPEYGMGERLLLDKLDRENHTVLMDGRVWPVRALPFPTVDPADPWALTEEEQAVLRELRTAFRGSPRLREHGAFLCRQGGMYRVCNGNLLYHGCIPMTEDGDLREVAVEGRALHGRALMDTTDRMVRRAFHEGDPDALDFMWYLWCGEASPVCGRRVRTFARAFIPDEAAWVEEQNPYYRWCRREESCQAILREFGLTGADCRIINGHTPIRAARGESPIKAGGRLVVIDGGFCKAYQKTTGIAGYTLIANSHGMRLMSHEPFTTLAEAQATGRDIHSQSHAFAVYPRRRYIADTDEGGRLRERMDDLLALMEAGRRGWLPLRG